MWKKFQLNFSSVEEWENEYYKINVLIDKKMIYENLWYKVK